MTTTINAKSTGIGGLDVTCDASGSLGLQTGGVTALTIDTSQNITTNGNIRLNNGAADGAQVILASSGYSDWNLDNYSGRFRAYYNATEYFTIDTSGNVGIGTTSPANYAGSGRVLQVNNSSSLSEIRLTNSSTGSGAGAYGTVFQQNGNDLYIYNGANSFMAFGTNNTERMRIDSSGNLLVGTTSGPDGIRLVVKSTTTESHDFYRATSTGGAVSVGYWMSDVNGTKTAVAYIRTNGGLSNYSANNTNLSDERIKTDILPATNYLDKICSIPVVTFKYKNIENAEDNLGVIAQDVEAVAPELVNNDGFGETPEDGIPLKSIYQTDLQYALMKCIQEQQTIINDLKARVTALEAK